MTVLPLRQPWPRCLEDAIATGNETLEELKT
jgi:hypothetical protein